MLWSRDLSSARSLAADAKNIYAVDDAGAVHALDKKTGANVWVQDKLKYRRLTAPAVWGAVILASLVNIVAPLGAAKFEALRTHPRLLVRVVDPATGKTNPVFFDNVARINAQDPESPLVGSGRFHIELVILDRLGLDVGKRKAR